MQYLLLIYQNEAQAGAATPAQMAAMHQEYGSFTQGIVKSGNFKAGDALQPTSTATTVTRPRRQDHHHRRPVRRDPGAARAATTSSRPRISTRPRRSRRAFPRARFGSIEVRPIRKMD